MTAILLAEITVHDPAEATDVVLRVGSQAYSHPSAPGFYADRLEAAGDLSWVTRRIFENGETLGAGANDYGQLSLVNLDGALDWLLDCFRDGRSVVLRIGEQDAPFAGFTTLFTGTAASITVGDTVVVTIHDWFTAVLDQPLSEDVFAGTGGLEGDDTLVDQTLPVFSGAPLLMPAVEVDPATLTWCPCDRGPITVTEVRVRGQGIALGTQRTDLAALVAATPAPGTVDWCPGTASERPHIKFGSTVDGTVQVTAQTGATAADRTAAQVFAALARDRAGVTVSAADLAALDAAQAAVVGGWWSGDTSIKTALDQVAETVGCGYWQDRDGTWRLVRLEAPGVPVASFARMSLERPGKVGEGDVLSCKPLWTSRDGGGIQPWKVSYRWGKAHAPLTRDAVVDAVSDADRARVTTEWLTASVEDPGIRDAHPLSVPLDRDSLFVDRTDALAEAARVQALQADRRRWEVTVATPPAVAALLDLGRTVTVEWPGYGLAGGKDVVILSLRLRPLAQVAEMTVWG